MFLKPLKIKFPLTETKLLLLSLTFAGLSFWIFRYNQLKVKIPLQGQEAVRLEFVINQEPVFSGNWQILRYRNLKIYAPKALPLYFGDKVAVSGYLEAGSPLVIKPRVKVIDHSRGWGFRRSLISLRTQLTRKISSLLSEPQASLLNGIVLGLKSNLPEEFSNQLKRTGTVHVVVVSGYNISLFGKVVSASTRFLGEKLSLGCSVIFLLAYALLAGAEPPVMRAFLMGALVCFGDFLGRPVMALRLLLVSALAMMVIDPLIVGDLSFQLSFLSAFSLLTVEPWLEKLSPQPWLESFWASLAAQIMVWPLIAFYFGTVSLWSPLANLLVLWSVEPAMIFGLLLIITPLTPHFLSQISSFVALIPLTFFVKYVDLLSRLPFSLLPLVMGRLELLLYYLLVMAVISLSWWRSKEPHAA